MTPAWALALGLAGAGLQGSLFGHKARLLHPAFLALAPLALALGLALAIRSARRASRLVALVPEERREQVVRGASAQQGGLRGAALGLGLALLCLAASSPQCGERTELVKRAGVDLVMAIDASTSMLARDVKPSRLERTKLEVSALLDRLKGDRVGLVVFAAEAFVQSPLTVDYAAARLFLRAIDPGAMPQQGTAIAAALRESKRLLEGGGRTGAARVVLLLTDGEDQEGEAEVAARELADANVLLYAAAVGSEAGEPIPILDPKGNVTGYKKDKEGKIVLTRTDVAGLRDLATKAGGQLLRGENGDLGLGRFLEELDQLQRGDLESRLSVQYDDKSALVAWPAFLLLLLGAALGEGPLRRRG